MTDATKPTLPVKQQQRDATKPVKPVTTKKSKAKK